MQSFSHHDETMTEKKEVFIVPISSYQNCPSALEFVARSMNKPISQVTNYEFYESFYVFEEKNYSFYHCLIFAYFLHSFAHRTTSLWLSSLFEKIVFHKNQLSLYSNKDKLYASLTNGLKSLIQEKIARPGQSQSIQELFVSMFLGDSFFREGLVIVLKEFLIGHIQQLNILEYQVFESLGNMDQIISSLRKPQSIEPNKGIYELFSKILDGCIEIHSLRIENGKIESCLYSRQEEKQKILLMSTEDKEKGRGYYVMISKEQAEIISKNYLPSQDMKGTMYYSMESSSIEIEEDLKSKLDKAKEWISQGISSKEKALSKTAIKLNRELLLQKLKKVVNIMDDHSNDLSRMANGLGKQQDQTPKNRPCAKYTSPFSPSINVTEFKTPILTVKNYENPFANTKSNNNYSSEKNLNPRVNVLPPIEEKSKQRVAPLANPHMVPRNNLLERLFNNMPPIKKDLLKPPQPMTQDLDSSFSSQIPLPKLGYESADEFHSFDCSQFENSFLGDKMMHEDKENKNMNFLNMRSPLKKIKVYSHQRDTVVANVDKEANYLQEILQKSPQNSPNIRRLILENNAY